MLRKALTEEGVAKLKAPGAGHIDYFDTLVPGLILRVGYGGSKTWLVRHYLKRRDADGKKISIPTTQKLERYPILKVKEARERARTFLADPVKAKQQADVGSFKDVAENYIRRHVEDPDHPLRTRDEIVRLLTNLVYPSWGDRRFRDIKRSDVSNLLDGIEDNNGKRQAGKVLAYIRAMMNWFASRNDDYVSPIVKDTGKRYRMHKRDRVLGNVRINGSYDDSELRALWKACGEMGTFGALLKVALLTGQRRDKIMTMRHDDVRGGVWTIPYAPGEKTNARSLKLPPAVLDIINAQQKIAGNPYVFAGRGHGPIRSLAQGKKALDEKLRKDMPPWVIHDLRRTAKTLMARAGVRPDISERVLGHTIKGVEGVYDQHSYEDEKADALNTLAALVERIINPPADNVKELADARQRRGRRASAAADRSSI